MDYLTHIITTSSYYINLDSRRDRNELFINHFLENNLPIPKRISAVQAFEGMSDGNQWLGDKEKCSLAAQACIKSHLIAIENAYLNKADYALIFEDDAYFLDGGIEIVNKCLHQLFNEVEDWDLYFLGANIENNSNRLLTKNLLECVNCYCAHAYLLNSNKFEYMLDNKNNINFIDSFYNNMIKNKFVSYPLSVVQREGVTSDLAGGKPNSSLSFWEKQYTNITYE